MTEPAQVGDTLHPYLPDSADPEAAAGDAAAAAASLAARLGDLADVLSDEDRVTFAALLLSAMDPVSARRWQPSSGLQPDQLAFLERLADRQQPTEPWREA